MNYRLFFKNIFLCLILLLNIITLTTASAFPREIILIRHADKLNQLDPGPFLSPQGVRRAELFSQYYLGMYREPEYIITTAQTDYSYRELQTVIPLVTSFAILHPLGGQPILLSDVYKHEKTFHGLKKLYNDLLNDNKFSDKTILICWHHAEIPKLLKALGATQPQPVLADDDYDTVYHLLFDRHNGAVQLIVSPTQYPLNEMPINASTSLSVLPVKTG